METVTDTYIQWKWEHYDQDVIKSQYICHTPARKNTQTNSIPSFPTKSPLPFKTFPIPPFLGIFGKVNPTLLKKKFGRGGQLTMCVYIYKFTKTNVLKVKLIQSSIAHVCVLCILQYSFNSPNYGCVYLHFIYHNIFV